MVHIDAAVTDRKSGAAIDGLEAHDFVLTEDGTPQPVSYLSHGKLPLAIALCVDISDSSNPMVGTYLNRARSLAQNLPPGDDLTVLAYTNHVMLVQPYTHDPAHILDGLAGVNRLWDPERPTFIDEAVFTATQFAAVTPRPDQRRVELWLTDGTSNPPEPQMYPSISMPSVIHTRKQATDELLRSGEVIALLRMESAVGHGREANRGEREEELDAYAKLTGGPILELAGHGANQIAETIAELHRRYVLGFQPAPASHGAPRRHHLTLTLAPEYFIAHPSVTPETVEVKTRESYVR